MVDVNLSFSLLLSLSYIYIISPNCLSVKHFFIFLSDRQVRTSFSFISLLITLRALSLLIFTLRHFTCPTVFTRVKASYSLKVLSLHPVKNYCLPFCLERVNTPRVWWVFLPLSYVFIISSFSYFVKHFF